jgi:hypothetical protein
LETPPIVLLPSGETKELKACRTCHIWRPLRSKHCSSCDNCVLEFDHHCPWISNCVGIRNYKFFVGFVLSVTSLCVYVAAWSMYVFGSSWAHASLEEAMLEKEGAMWLFVWSASVAGCCIGPLLCFHFFLITTGSTTAEHLTGENVAAEAEMGSDWARTGRNLLALCHRPIPESHVMLRAYVPEETDFDSYSDHDRDQNTPVPAGGVGVVVVADPMQDSSSDGEEEGLMKEMTEFPINPVIRREEFEFHSEDADSDAALESISAVENGGASSGSEEFLNGSIFSLHN